MKKKIKKTKRVIKKSGVKKIKLSRVKKPVVVKKKKQIAKKTIVRPVVKKSNHKPIGVVTHFYNEIGVAIVRFKEKVPLGAILYFRGATTDFKYPIKSMQYEHEPIRVAPKGKQIGIKVPKRVRVGDNVHRAY